MESRIRDHLLEDLESSDEEVRRLAVERAPSLPEDEAARVLADRLGDPSWRVRKAAVERLGQVRGGARVAPLLLAALADDDNPGRRNAALEVLRRLGTVALPALLEASRDPDVDVRKQVVDALAGIGDASARSRLEALLRDEDANVRGAAADALGASGQRDAAAALRRALAEDDETLVRLSALRSLVRLGSEVPLEELKQALDDPGLRSAAYELLGECDDPEAEPHLLAGLAARRSAREAAMGALVARACRLPVPERQALTARIRAAVEEHPETLAQALDRLATAPLPRRRVAVQFLGLVARPDVLAPLLEAGGDPTLEPLVLSSLDGFGREIDEQVAGVWGELTPLARTVAIRLLARTGAAEGDAVLRSALESGSLELRVEAARALGRRGNEACLPDLARALERTADEADEDDDEALEALADALVQATASSPRAARRAVDLLSSVSREAPEAYRVAAARVLGEIGSCGDVSNVALLLSDPSDRVRREAVHALGRVAQGHALDVLRMALADESPRVRIAAASALVESEDPAALDGLASLFTDEDARVRAAALRALAGCTGAAESERALEMLRAGVAEEGVVALAALEALTRLGGDAAAELAGGLLGASDGDVLGAAVACIGRHGGEAALGRLVEALGHPVWSVRAAVAQAFAERGFARAVPPLLRRLEVEGDEFVREALLAALARLEP